MLTPRGHLKTLVAFHTDGLPLPLSLDSAGNLMVSLGDPGTPPASQPTPRGNLITPVAFYQDGIPLPLSLDANGYLMVNLNKVLREVLTADRTYYVRTDGHDANDGLTNAVGGAFATIQHAYDVIAGMLDLGGQTVTIQIEDGTYTAGLVINQPWTGGGEIYIVGNTGNMDSVYIHPASGNDIEIDAPLPGSLHLHYVKLSSVNSDCILLQAPGVMLIGNIDFGSANVYHIASTAAGALIEIDGAYTISGGAVSHWYADYGFIYLLGSIAITLTGTPAFSTAFAIATDLGFIYVHATCSFMGSATGVRFAVSYNSIINTAGQGLTWLPGNAAGTIATGGFYNAYPAAVMTQTYSTADATLAAQTSISVTNNVSGSGSTVADPEGSYTRATQRNNFWALADQYNKLRADHLDLAQFVNSLVDFLQVLGILQ